MCSPDPGAIAAQTPAGSAQHHWYIQGGKCSLHPLTCTEWKPNLWVESIIPHPAGHLRNVPEGMPVWLHGEGWTESWCRGDPGPGTRRALSGAGSQPISWPSGLSEKNLNRAQQGLRLLRRTRVGVEFLWLRFKYRFPRLPFRLLLTLIISGSQDRACS